MSATARANSVVKAERAAQFDLLGDERVHRQFHFAAEAELNDDAAGPDDVEAAPQGRFIAGSLEHHVKFALVGRVRREPLRRRARY